uniref:Chromate transporter n=1 Tax=Candidatus Caldatribacterium californiense TaxID=1454726 RepID=A0A7V3YMA2_9BACT
MFGGHYAVIPILRHVVIARYGWISEKEFLDLWAISESTSGPTALNAATYTGYKVHGFPGTVVATLGVMTAPFF